MKKVLSFALAIGMVLTLAACGGDKTPTNPFLGLWSLEDDGDTIFFEFKADDTLVMSSYGDSYNGTYTWTADAGTATVDDVDIAMTMASGTFTIVVEGDTYTLTTATQADLDADNAYWNDEDGDDDDDSGLTSGLALSGQWFDDTDMTLLTFEGEDYFTMETPTAMHGGFYSYDGTEVALDLGDDGYLYGEIDSYGDLVFEGRSGYFIHAYNSQLIGEWYNDTAETTITFEGYDFEIEYLDDYLTGNYFFDGESLTLTSSDGETEYGEMDSDGDLVFDNLDGYFTRVG